MLGWVSTISRTLSRPVGYLDRSLGSRKPTTAQWRGLTPDQEPVSVLRQAPGAGNDDTVDEWQTVAEGKTVPKWKIVAERQPVPEWTAGAETQPVPEWKTDMWKRKVEGEAKKHFDGEIAGVGRHRS